jgi:hypothetical protein
MLGVYTLNNSVSAGHLLECSQILLFYCQEHFRCAYFFHNVIEIVWLDNNTVITGA